MIILDYNQIALSNIQAQHLGIEEDLIRHMILNSIRMYNQKFKSEYGDIVIAADGAFSWRREQFPQYKASRRKTRDESTTTDWKEVFRILSMVREEIVENLHYRVLRFDGAEADDVIGTLAEYTQEFGKHEPVMIVSADHDFIQLQKYDNVKQYSPLQKKFVKDKNPRSYLFEHIMRGDSGDGVPNVLSPDNAFVDSIRQSPVTQKKLDIWVQNSENLKAVMDENTYRNYQRNKTLIELTNTPPHLKEQIINTFEGYAPPHKSKLLNYLIKKRCKLLIECIEEFY
jgi:hypothetical protein